MGIGLTDFLVMKIASMRSRGMSLRGMHDRGAELISDLTDNLVLSVRKTHNHVIVNEMRLTQDANWS